MKIRKHPELRDLFLETERIDQALERIVGKTSNCIDVGCHFGSMLSTLVRLAPQGKHLAFEPIPFKAAMLRRKFPEVEIHQAALGETPGRVTFFDNVTRPGFSGMQATTGASDVSVEITVDCLRLDDFWMQDRPIRFIKLDVEGAEFLVLRGAVNLIGRDLPWLLFESIPGGVERFGATRREFFDFLSSELGYSIFTISDFLAGEKPLVWDQFEQAHHYPFRALNYFAVSRASS